MPKSKKRRIKDLITRQQIIHTWATFARELNWPIEPKCLESMVKYTKETIEFLEEVLNDEN